MTKNSSTACSRTSFSTPREPRGRFKSPVIQDDEHLLIVLRYIESNPLRAAMVSDAGEYRWSSYQAHGLGRVDPLLSPMPELESLGRTPSERRARWRRK